jgi:hypothetical protein
MIDRTRATEGEPRGPGWFGLPAVRQYHISTPRLLLAFAAANEGRTYADSIKPFSFLLTAEPSRIGGNQRDDLLLLAPYRKLPDEWANLRWWNLHAEGRRRSITYRLVSEVDSSHTDPRVVEYRSYRELVAAFRRSAESKADSLDGPAGKDTAGQIIPPIIDVGAVAHIGKEMNYLDEVRAGVRSFREATLRYPRRKDPIEKLAVARLGLARVAEAAMVPESTLRGFVLGAETGEHTSARVHGALQELASLELVEWAEDPTDRRLGPVVLRFVVGWGRRVGRVADLYRDACAALRLLSPAAVGWVAERAFVDRSTVYKASDSAIRADIVEAISAAIWLGVGIVNERQYASPEPTGMEHLLSLQQAEVMRDFERNKARVSATADAEQRSRIDAEISRELQARSARHHAEIRRMRTVMVADRASREERILRAFSLVIEKGEIPLCPHCFRPMGFGDGYCGRDACRKAASRASEVVQLPEPPEPVGKPGPHKKPKRLRVELLPDSGWGEVRAKWPTSRYAEVDPLPGRTDECRTGRHSECPAGRHAPNETTIAAGQGAPPLGSIACPCRCHRRFGP